MRNACVMLLVLLAALGCESNRERLKRLQLERRIQMEVVQSFRPPVVDAIALAEEQPFAGSVRSGRVLVRHPAGMARLAREVAEKIAGMYGFVERHTGVRWSFGVVTELIRVDEAPAVIVGDRVELADGNCRVRLFVPADDETFDAVVRSNPLFPYSFVHEMTELSLACPASGRNPLLLDVEMDDKRIINHTRWFREGIANYAGELVTRDYCGAGHREIIHKRPFAAVHDAGHMLDQWNGFSNRFQEGRYEKTYYNAALGVILQVVRLKGEAALRRMLEDLDKEILANGAAIERAMVRHVGMTPAQLARGITVPFIGIEPRDLTGARAKNLGIDAPCGVVVLKTRLFSPARKCGLESNDAIVMSNGRPVQSSSHLERLLMEHGIGTPMRLTVWRAGRRIMVSVKPVRRPRLDLLEESWL